MSSQPPPSNGWYSGVSYNPNFFQQGSAKGATEEWVEQNFLETNGYPDDNAQTTTFSGQIISTNPTNGEK
jgi:hypothetical protein